MFTRGGGGVLACACDYDRDDGLFILTLNLVENEVNQQLDPFLPIMRPG